jgi:hypothetical protein
MLSAQPWKNRAFWAAALLIGFLLSWLPLVLLPTIIPAPDEQYQALEAGHRLVFGYGMVPWEFDYAARSWALGYLSAIPMSVAALLGAGPEFYIPLTWAFFALGAAAMMLCAGLWGARFYGRWGGLAVALAAATWLDNLYFGGRALGEVVSAHLLIIAVWLAEPGERVENRNRLIAAGLLAVMAVMLRLQLGPAVLLLFLWRWRDRQRLLHLGVGAVAALVLTGIFDTLTWGAPFAPLWQNLYFNLFLNGGNAFGTAPFWGYFPLLWQLAGWVIIPFAALAVLGARRLPLLGVMVLVIIACHMIIPHKEYRFLLPATMMASILFGIGLVEVGHRLAAWLKKPLGDVAGFLAGVVAGLVWLVMAGNNLGTITFVAPWKQSPHMLEMAMRISDLPQICGVGYAGDIPFGTGAYTFLHRPVPLYFNNMPEQTKDFVAAIPGYNALVLHKSGLDGMPEPYRDYALHHCGEQMCLLIRPGSCTDMRPPRPIVGSLRASLGTDNRYPYAAGVLP